MHHIITELESGTHTVAPALSTACQSNLCCSNENEEMSTKRAEEETAPAEDHQQPAATGSSIPAERLKGTVRRATRELEQKLRQELDVPAAAVPTSAPHSPPRRSPIHHLAPKDRAEDRPLSQNAEQKPATSQRHSGQMQDGTDKQEGGMVEVKEEKDGGGGKKAAQEPSSGGRKEAHAKSAAAAQCHAERRSDNTSSTASTAGSTPKPGHAATSVSAVRLEGVTEQDSSTDKEGPFGPRTEADLLEAWEMLKELGAFLWQVRGALASDPGPPSMWLPGRRAKLRDPRERARQAEARIRQAGLTPPSLMKRSASLAKLGSLELTANDLGDWDLDATVDAAAAAADHCMLVALPADDVSKKQRVHPQHHPSSPPSPSSSQSCTENPLKKVESLCHDDATVPVSATASCPSAHQRSGMALNSGHTPQSVPALISVATRQQYGRTHPLRRLKKKTVSFLYHTV